MPEAFTAVEPPPPATNPPAGRGSPARESRGWARAVLAAVRNNAPGPWVAEPIKLARFSKADLYRVRHSDGTSLVVKDYARKPWPFRLLGRWFLWNECSVYRQLRGRPGIPECRGLLDADALAMQDVCGVQLHRWPNMEADGGHLFRRLAEAVAGMHSAGVVHLDLRCRGNVLVTRERDVYIIDFASAVSVRPGGPGHALFFPLLAWIDQGALVKAKERLGLPLTAAEHALCAGTRVSGMLRRLLGISPPGPTRAAVAARRAAGERWLEGGGSSPP